MTDPFKAIAKALGHDDRPDAEDARAEGYVSARDWSEHTGMTYSTCKLQLDAAVADGSMVKIIARGGNGRQAMYRAAGV